MFFFGSAASGICQTTARTGTTLKTGTKIKTTASAKSGTKATTATRVKTGRQPLKTVPDIQFGIASFYAKKFQGRKTASGEIYDQRRYTAAHNNLPMGTWIKVTNTRNGRKVIVKVNDRLHHRNKRLVDLSYIAAAKLGYVSRGLAKVKVEIIGLKKPALTSR